MAEEEKKGEEVGEENKSSRSSPIKLILLIFVLLLVLGGAGVFVFLRFIAPAISGGAQTSSTVKKVETETDESDIGPMYPLDTFVVNLAASGGRRFLKVSMELELSSEKLRTEMDKRKAQIRDAVLTVLSDKSFDDIYSVGGKFRTREELMRRINVLLKNGKVRNIYFTEFVIQ